MAERVEFLRFPLRCPREPCIFPAMDLPTIIRDLEYFEGTFPRRALEAAIVAKEEITPLLLPLLTHPPATIHAWSAQKDYMAHIYALFLLAQFRESRAYPLIVN